MNAPASRIACIDLPALPLQLLLHDHPRWREHPAVVVEDDRPQGVITWVNEHARRMRILPGMRFAAARSLASQLRAAIVPPERIEHAMGELFAALCTFSPRVEPSPDRPGVFWLDPEGLAKLYGSLEQWSMAVSHELTARGFSSAVIVGFHRYRSYAIARTHAGCWVIHAPAREATMAAAVPLDRLAISPSLRDELAALGVHTLGEFMALPGHELRMRLGEEAKLLHDAASDAHWAPLLPRKLVDPIRDRIELEPPETDHARLLFRLKSALQHLLDRLAERGKALSALHLELRLDHADSHHECLEPAGPTLDVVQLVDLIRLRLDALSLPAGIEEVLLEAEGIRADVDQLTLFRTRRRRDLEAADRALARLRATFGADAVVCPVVRPAHLPEARFGWQPLRKVRFPRPSPLADQDRECDTQPRDPLPLVRRLLPRPLPLPDPPRHEPEAWPNLDPRQGAMVRMHGPFRISGGWWVKTVERDYYYVETQRGDVLWVFYDRPRRRWFLHGFVD